MAAGIDNQLIKVTWQDVRQEVAIVEPNLARIIDAINPDNTFTLYKVYYPYGETIADPVQMYLPSKNHGVCPLDQSTFSDDVNSDLGYGRNSWPMGIVLEKNIEAFIDFKDGNSTIPWMIYKPGTIFPYAKLLSEQNPRNYAPNNILTIVSGARSAFMLPNIGCFTHHVNLQKDYHVQSPPPKTLYEHWHIFKEIINSHASSAKWSSCLLYFSEKWVRYMRQDPAWISLKMYLHELAWSHFEYRRNYIYYEIAFSRIQKKRNLKPNPYLMDTASHLFKTALGDAPGFVPVCDNESLPLDTIQNAYTDSYGIKKYLPTIMQPGYFTFDQENNSPVYYSLQNPSTFVFSPKSRKVSSTLFEMHELEHIMKVFMGELSDEYSICYGTVLGEIAKKINFRYFHNELDCHRVVGHSSEIESADQRFRYVNSEHKIDGAVFASDAKFLRGCIGVYTK